MQSYQASEPSTATRPRTNEPLIKQRLPVTTWLLLAALILFLVGIFAPSVTITEFGRLRSLSLLGGIEMLWTTRHWLLAVLIFLFTILFPPAKLIVIALVATPSVPMTVRTRDHLRQLIECLGRWSLLDVVVIAILIVTIKVQGVVSVKAAWGIYVFTASIIASIMATHFFNERRPSSLTSSNQGSINKNPSVVSLSSRFRMKSLFPGFMVTTCGIGCLLVAPAPNVEQVLLTRKDTLVDIPRIFGNPSLFVVVKSTQGSQRLPTKPRTPLGNGLVWKLQQPLQLREVYEVEAFEEGWLTDKLVDRVSVNGRNLTGQRFAFQLQGGSDWHRPAALSVTVTGIILLLTPLILRKEKHNADS